MPADTLPHAPTIADLDARRLGGYTVRELARVLRVGPDRIRAWIRSGELPAISTASCRSGRPRYIVLPRDLDAWVQAHRVAAAPRPARRQKRTTAVDYYPD